MQRAPPGPASAFGGVGREEASHRSQRRTNESLQLQPYILSCDREPLNSRLGPADFFPPCSDDPELVLSMETVTAGYKEEVNTIEDDYVVLYSLTCTQACGASRLESREVLYSLVSAQALWTKQSIQRCRTALRARFRALTTALARKRKANQVFGVPLSGPLLARPGTHPELKPPPSEEAHRRFLSDLAAGKPLRQLAEFVPQGLHGGVLVEGILRGALPVVRATWLVKVCYLGLVRPLQIAGLGGGGSPLVDKSQGKRTDAWTRDLLGYMDGLLCQLAGTTQSSSKLGRLGFSSPREKGGFGGGGSVGLEQQWGVGGSMSDENWQRLVGLLAAHFGEGLLNPSTVVDWTLQRFGDTSGPVAKVGLLLPVIYALLDGLLLEAHLREIIHAALAWLARLCPPGRGVPSVESGSGEGETALMLAELVRCILMAAPDSFVGVGALPLPDCVLKCGDEQGLERPVVESQGSGIVAAVQAGVLKRRALLAAAVNPVVLRNNEARAVAALDRALLLGEVGASCAAFNDPLVGSSPEGGGGRAELRAVVALVCEWAVCAVRNVWEGRNVRSVRGGAKERDVRTGAEGRDVQTVQGGLGERTDDASLLEESTGHNGASAQRDGIVGGLAVARVHMAAAVLCNLSQKESAPEGRSTWDEGNPQVLHELLVEWLENRAAPVTEPGKLLQEALLGELVRPGLFDPVRFARDLVANGALEQRNTACERARAHKLWECLRQLPGDATRAGESFEMEKRAALATGCRRKRGRGKRTEGGVNRHLVENVQRCVMFLLELPTAQGEGRRGGGAEGRGEDCTPVKRRKVEESGGEQRLALNLAVDRWWLWTTQERAVGVKDENPQNKTPTDVDAKGVEDISGGSAMLGGGREAAKDGVETFSWGVFEVGIVGLGFPEKREVASWLVTRIRESQGRASEGAPEAFAENAEYTSGAPHPGPSYRSVGGKSSGAAGGQGRAVGREEDVRWQELGSGTEGGVNQSGGEHRRWALSNKRLLGIVYILDRLWQHGALTDLLLTLLDGGGARETIPPHKGGDVPEHSVECSLALLWRYAPILAARERLPELFAALAKRAYAGGGVGDLAKLAGLAAKLRKQYGGLRCVVAWEEEARNGLGGSKFWAEVDKVSSSGGKNFSGILGGDFERLRSQCKRQLDKETGAAAQLARVLETGSVHTRTENQPAENDIQALGKKAGATLCIEKGGEIGIAAAVAAVVEVSVDALVALEGGSGGLGVLVKKRQRSASHLLAFCLSAVSALHDSCRSHVFLTGVVHAVVQAVQAAFSKQTRATSKSPLYSHMSPETPDVGPETLPDADGGEVQESAAAALALALTAALIAEGLLDLAEVLDALHLVKTLGGPLSNVLASRAAVLWFRVLFGGACLDAEKDDVGVAVKSLLEGPYAFCLSCDQARLPIETVYSTTCSLLRVSSSQECPSPQAETGVSKGLRNPAGSDGPAFLLETEAAGALSESLPHLRDLLLSDTGRLHELIRTDGAQAVAAAAADARRKQGELATWQDVVLKLVPMQGTCLLRALVESSVPQKGGGRTMTEERLRELEALRVPPKGGTAEERVKRLEAGLVEEMLDCLEGIHTSTFHWRWLRVRLLLDEQVLLEKLRGGASAVAALASVRSLDAAQLAESEKTFTTAVLTRLLVRPDAAPLYSQLAQALGRGFGEYLIQQVRWALEGSDMLQGRKSLRQLLEASAARDGFRVKYNWGPTNSGWQEGPPENPKYSQNPKQPSSSARGRGTGLSARRVGGGETEGAQMGISEGATPTPNVHTSDKPLSMGLQLERVGLSGAQLNTTIDHASPKSPSDEPCRATPAKETTLEGVGHDCPVEGASRLVNPFGLERALAELVLPLLAQSSPEACSSFAAELVRELTALEAYISALARHANKPTATEAPTPTKWGKGLEGLGSPRTGGGQWGAASELQAPASMAALQTSLWLRLQFVLPMLPQVHADRDPTARNMRLSFAPVLLRLLASPIVQESPLSTDAPQAPSESYFTQEMDPKPPSPPDPERKYAEAAAAAAAASAGEGLFGRLLAVLHALMSSTWLEWLKPPAGRGPVKVLRDVGPFDRQVAERMQAELDSMRVRLCASVHRRLQAAMPYLPHNRCSVHTIVSVKSLPISSSHPSMSGSLQFEAALHNESGIEVDPWLLLEEGAIGGTVQASNEMSIAPKAAPWLKGAVRVARKELTYAPKDEEEED